MTSPPVKALLDLHILTKTIITTTKKIMGTINMNRTIGPNMSKKSKICNYLSPLNSLGDFNRTEILTLITFTRCEPEISRSEQINGVHIILGVVTSISEKENYADSIILIEEALC